MDLKFSEMSMDTSLAKGYLDKNKTLLELYNDYEGTLKNIAQQDEKYVYNGKTFITIPSHIVGLAPGEDFENIPNTLRIMASSLKKNASLIAQLEYHFRNIPIEVTNAQLNLLIQYMNCCHRVTEHAGCNYFFQDDSLLFLGTQILRICDTNTIYCISRETAAICHLFITLLHDAHDERYKDCHLEFQLHSIFTREDINSSRMKMVKGLDSGTVAAVCDDADVDSAVDKLISVSKQAPWRLRRILVQESVYQQFKDALSWKCNLKTSGDKPETSDVLCSHSLTYNDITFLLDPVELVEVNPSVVTVEAYRTTKEMISLVQQDKTRYLSLWANGIAEINEVTHATKSPVVWVNTVADFRGPAQVSEAVLSYTDINSFSDFAVECDNVTKLRKLSQSWLKLDVESRRDILCSVLDKYILLNNANKQLTEIRNSLLTCTLKSFVDVGNDYVCIGMSQPLGITWYDENTIFSVESFKSMLQGNALLLSRSPPEDDLSLLEQAGVPVILTQKNSVDKCSSKVFKWKLGLDSVTRVVWTNSGTIFAN